MEKNADTLRLELALSKTNRRSQWFIQERNWVILKASVLVWRFLTYPAQIRWIKKMLALIVDYCFNPLNWLEWMKLFEMAWNCNLFPITFLMSFLRVFNKIIGWNILGELYKVLLGLGIIIDNDNLKCNS